MSQINPITGSILQASQAHGEMSSDKAHQMRHTQQLRKNTAAQEDEYVPEDEQVANSPEAISAANGDQQHDRKQRRGPSQKQDDLEDDPDQPPRLDLTA